MKNAVKNTTKKSLLQRIIDRIRKMTGSDEKKNTGLTCCVCGKGGTGGLQGGKSFMWICPDCAFPTDADLRKEEEKDD